MGWATQEAALTPEVALTAARVRDAMAGDAGASTAAMALKMYAEHQSPQPPAGDAGASTAGGAGAAVVAE